MKNSKKLLFALPLLVLSATGCGVHSGDQDDGPVDVNLASDYKAEISILIPNGEREQGMVDKAVEQFNLKYPYVTVKKKFVNVDAWENTVRNQNIAGILPDIVWTNSPDYYFLIDSKIGLNLTPYITASEAEGDFNFKEDFYTEYFDMGAKDGKQYCIPRSCDSVVTFYNKEVLANANISLDGIENGWTWDTFMGKLAEYRAYLDKNGKSSWYCLDMNLYNWLSVNYPILRSYGADIINKNLDITVDSPEVREALGLVREMVDKRYIPYPGSDCGNSFEAGTGPFLFQSAAPSVYDTAILKGKFDVVSFPLINKYSMPKIGCGIAGYAINAKTKHKVACWQLLNTMMSYDGQQAMAEGGLNLPSIRKDLQNRDTANWMKKYSALNLEAYTYGAEYKIVPEFISWADPRAKASLDLAVRDLFYNATRNDKENPIEFAIKECKLELEDALNY